MPSWILSLFKPLVGIVTKRQDRKIAKDAAKAKLTMASMENAQKLELNKDEYEIIATKGLESSWKDEYATVSVVSILNLIVFGGIASAFGYPQVLTGVGTAVQALTAAGVDVGFLMQAVVLAAVGLSVWKKF